MSARVLINEQATPLSDAFFHPENVELIQRAVIGKTCKRTGFLIPKQDESKILIVMRSMYLQYSPDLRGDLRQQLRDLDAMTIDEILADIIPTLELQNHYVNMISNPTAVLERPAWSSKAGTNGVRPRL